MPLQSLEMKPHGCTSFISRAKNQGLKPQSFAVQAQNFIDTSRRVTFLVLVALYGTNGSNAVKGAALLLRIILDISTDHFGHQRGPK